MRSLKSAFVLAGVALTTIVGCNSGQNEQVRIEKAESQVRGIAEKLDRQTTDSGVFIRVAQDELQEKDPWDTRIQVTYARGGLAETLTVRSAGPDRQLMTDDDIVASGSSVNLVGVGEGIKANVEETTAKAAKGAVKGVVEGVKQSIKESLPRKASPDAASGAEPGAKVAD